MKRPSLAAIALALSLVDVGVAYADERAAAESLYREGKAKLEAGRLDEACAHFEASLAAEPSIGAELNLALCNEKRSHFAAAHRHYLKAAAMADADGQGPRAKVARDFAARLEPRLVELEVDGCTGELNVDGEAWAGGWVEPGEHALACDAPGFVSQRRDVSTTAGEPQRIVFEPLVRLDEGEKGSRFPYTVAGGVAIGLGAVGLGVGAALGITALADRRDIIDDPALCQQLRCTPAGEDAVDALSLKAAGSTAALVTGGILLTGGIALVLVAPPDPLGEGWSLRVAPNGASAILRF